MYVIDDKLDKFSETIYTKATREKEAIIKRAKREKDCNIKEKELNYLEKAYTCIQDSIRGIDQQKEEMISKAYMEQKKQLLHAREAVAREVYDMAVSQLKEYTKTDAYKEFLFTSLEDNLAQLGDGEISVTLSPKDERFLDELKAKHGDIFRLYDGHDDLLGGSILENKTNRRYINDTLLENLNETLHKKFNEVCGLKIN